MLTPQSDGSLAAEVERGAGTTLDGESTLWSTRRDLDGATRGIARLAGNLASQSGADVAGELQAQQLEFVVVPPSSPADPAPQQALAQRAAESLDGNPALQAVGSTSVGSLWRFTDLTVEPPSATGRTPLGTGMLVAQGVIIALALLLGIPTGRRRRVVQEATLPGDDPAETFDEDEHD